MAVDLQTGPVLPASVLSSIAESSQRVSFILAKGRSADKGGVARAQLNVLGSFFLWCAPLPWIKVQTHPKSQFCLLPFLSQASLSHGPQPHYGVFFKSLRCPDTYIDHLTNIWRSCGNWKESYMLIWGQNLPPCGVLGPWEERTLHRISRRRRSASALAGLPQRFPAFVGLCPTIMLFEHI